MISLGLLGYPLSHSVSPRLHGAALMEMGLAGEYQLYPVPPVPGGEAEIAALLDRVRQGEIRGLNVTIPHKQSVQPYLDELTPLAEMIGAVNTIYLHDGRLVGDNTDAPGFWSDLQRVFPGLNAPLADQDEHRHALVLGAGGAARAVVFVLALAGWQVTIAARRLAQADDLVEDLEAHTYRHNDGTGDAKLKQIDAIPLALAGLLSTGAQLVVNATPVGMVPDVENSPWPEGASFPEEVAVYDLVYKPPETALLQAARRDGLRAVNGVGMLIEQAALALETWTGRTAPRKPMWQAVPEYHDNSQQTYWDGL